MLKVSGSRQAPCGLCLDGENKLVFAVKSKGINGDLCPDHMAVVLEQANGKKEPTERIDK